VINEFESDNLLLDRYIIYLNKLSASFLCFKVNILTNLLAFILKREVLALDIIFTCFGKLLLSAASQKTSSLQIYAKILVSFLFFVVNFSTESSQ
jgi:hypothetical protein